MHGIVIMLFNVFCKHFLPWINIMLDRSFKPASALDLVVRVAYSVVTVKASVRVMRQLVCLIHK